MLLTTRIISSVWQHGRERQIASKQQGLEFGFIAPFAEKDTEKDGEERSYDEALLHQDANAVRDIRMHGFLSVAFKVTFRPLT